MIQFNIITTMYNKDSFTIKKRTNWGPVLALQRRSQEDLEVNLVSQVDTLTNKNQWGTCLSITEKESGRLRSEFRKPFPREVSNFRRLSLSGYGL